MSRKRTKLKLGSVLRFGSYGCTVFLRPGMDPRSQKAAEFAAELIFGQCYDYVVKQAVRHQQSLVEVLEHANIEKVWQVIVSPAATAAPAEEPGDGLAAQTALLVNLVPADSLAKLNVPQRASELETVQAAASMARKQVKSQVQTVDGSQSLARLAKALRSLEVCEKLRGSTESSVMVLYNIESAGEHEKDSRRSPTPVRRDQMEKVLRAMMSTRGDTLPDFNDEKIIFPKLDASDVQLAVIDNSQ